MNSKDGVPRRAILVMTAILVSVILGAQASSRATHQIFSPTVPFAPLVTNVLNNGPSKQHVAGAQASKASVGITNSSIMAHTVKNGKLYAVTNNRIVHIKGEIESSATWTHDKIYYIDSVEIPSGVILTIEPGTVVRVEGSNGFVLNGGTLLAQGTDAPITITSSSDMLGKAGDYSTAVTVNAGQALLRGVYISNAINGVVVTSGLAIVQGAINTVSSNAITACSWNDMQCAVDASRADILAGGVCGKVLMNSQAAQGVLASPNCDSSPAPRQVLEGSTINFTQHLTMRMEACTMGDATACDTMQQPITCVNDSLATLRGGIGFVVPEVLSIDDAVAFSGRVNASAGSFAVQQAQENSTNTAISALLTNLTDTYSQLKHVYDTCSPS